MQDITDESEHDLQSVFNKISESLKTINQEAGEIQLSQSTFTVGESVSERGVSEQGPSSSASNKVSIADFSFSDHVKALDKTNTDNLLENNISSGIDKLVQETALEISNLLSEREVVATQQNLFERVESKSNDDAEILLEISLQNVNENLNKSAFEPEVARSNFKDIIHTIPEKNELPQKNEKNIFTRDEDAQEPDYQSEKEKTNTVENAQYISQASSTSENDETKGSESSSMNYSNKQETSLDHNLQSAKNIYEDLTPSNSGSETQENEVFSSENSLSTDQIDKLKPRFAKSTWDERNTGNLISNKTDAVSSDEKIEPEEKGQPNLENLEQKLSLDLVKPVNLEQHCSKDLETNNDLIAEAPTLDNRKESMEKKELGTETANKQIEEDELLNEKIENEEPSDEKRIEINELKTLEEHGSFNNEEETVQLKNVTIEPIEKNTETEPNNYHDITADDKKTALESDYKEVESLIECKIIGLDNKKSNEKCVSDEKEEEGNVKEVEKIKSTSNVKEEEGNVKEGGKIVVEECNTGKTNDNVSSNKKTELTQSKGDVFEEPMVISLDDSDEDKPETGKKSDKSEIATEEKKNVVDKSELMETETENGKSILEKTDVGKSNNKQFIGPDEIIDLDDENSNDEKSAKDEEVEKISTQSTGDEQIERKESDTKIKDLKDHNIPNVNEIAKHKMEPAVNVSNETQELNEKLQNEEKGSEKNETKSEKPSDKGKIELEILEKPIESVEKYTFYNKECVNYECNKTCKLYFLAPIFVLNFYKVIIKQNLPQYVCDDCYEAVVSKYEEWCNLLETQQPIFLTNIPQKTNEFVEILDSSEEEDTNGNRNENKSNDFSEETIDMIQKELDDVIASVVSRNEIQNQLTWSKTLLEHRIAKIKESSDWINDTLSVLQKNADKMNNALYQCPKIEMKTLTPFDLNSGKAYVLGESTQANQLTIPPIGEIYRPPIAVAGEYFAAKNKVIASWLACTVVESVDPPSSEKQKSIKYYKVKFFKMKVPTYKAVPAKHLAYADVPKVQLSIGTRVIALFDASTLYKTKEYHGDIKSAFYPGVIAEALQPYNNYRYLIFFDDGYTQYVHHRDVRLICEVSANVWDDIHPGSRDFIQNYLINYKKNRPMVQVKKGQSMVTELNGKWIYAKVVDVDASLIQMLFEGQKNHTEWIYRGSTRLGPLFKAIQKTNIPQVTRLPRRSEPFVRYMQDDENAKQQQQPQNNATPQNEPPPTTTQVRSQVARKSTTRQESQEHSVPATAVKHLNNSTIFVDDEEPKGTLIYYSSKSENNPPPRPFKPHMCGPYCITREHFEGHYGVLSKPLLNSWERTIYKIKSKKTSIVYRSPCGRNLRSIEEVHKYLRLTRNLLNVENFVFDPDVGCLNEYQVKKCIVNKSDITEGREKIPIQCVNYYDHTMPPDCEYSADRIPTEGVNLNVNPEFLVGCDCKDDCTDKSKCSCWKLTLEGARYGNPHTPLENIGYYYKRLLEPVTTGIYECNSRCKCSSKCINRVVQHPLETKLQVFKTSNRGWGLRCINDVPKGAFICIYAGNLLTEQRANECGDGDEYFAELDYIEVAERLKEGYESDAQEDIESDEYVPEHDSDEEFNPKPSEKSAAPVITRNKTATAKRSNSSTTNGTNDDDDEQERQAINFVPNTQLENYEEITTKYKSMRRLFGKNEYCYIMDAKSIGNVGRYFNHSCSPNLFVQNVFVDTHDLRFPWVAFFALINIRAGTELTWNYNYEVGVVPGKVLFCQCGAANCRGRLL